MSGKKLTTSTSKQNYFSHLSSRRPCCSSSC